MLRLTTENLPAAYEYLRACEPFSRWKLPHADEIEFRVTRHVDRFGHFDDRDGKAVWHIAISTKHVTTTKLLLETMAHEMAHHVLKIRGHRGWAAHGKAFQKLAHQICRSHGFSYEDFV